MNPPRSVDGSQAAASSRNYDPLRGPATRLRATGYKLPAGECNLHARDVEAGIDHHDFTGDGFSGITEEKRGGLGDFRRVDIPPERRALAVDREDVRKT